MLHEKVVEYNYCFLFNEVLSSLREVNCRLNELESIVKLNWCTPDGKKEIEERVRKLMNTRFSLICSIYDIREKVLFHFPKNLNMENILKLENLYKELKNI